MFSRLFKLLIAVSLLCSAGCAHLDQTVATVPEQPVATWVVKRIEGETGKYYVVFRNVGSEVISFDYTLSDRENVPHIDANGPNSGLIENLYPGIEKELANPYDSSRVWVNVGKVTVGKRPAPELSTLYGVSTPELDVSSDLPPL